MSLFGGITTGKSCKEAADDNGMTAEEQDAEAARAMAAQEARAADEAREMATLPYQGDVQAAMKAGDRAAIKVSHSCLYN